MTQKTPEEPLEERVRRRLDAFRQFVQECQACQTEAPAHYQYCAQCGSRLSTQCPGCGNPLPPKGAKYCPHCGMQIPGETSSAS
jgi:rRNA maturation endonuclease Nob1